MLRGLSEVAANKDDGENFSDFYIKLLDVMIYLNYFSLAKAWEFLDRQGLSSVIQH